MAKYVAHHLYQLQHPFIVDVIKDPIGFFVAAEDVFFPENGQVLRDVALAGAYLFYDVLDANGLVT